MERRHACGKHFRDKISRILKTDGMRGEVSGFSSPRYWVNSGVTSIKLHRKTRFGRNQGFALQMTFSREVGVVPLRVIHIQIRHRESEVEPCRYVRLSTTGQQAVKAHGPKGWEQRRKRSVFWSRGDLRVWKTNVIWDFMLWRSLITFIILKLVMISPRFKIFKMFCRPRRRHVQYGMLPGIPGVRSEGPLLT